MRRLSVVLLLAGLLVLGCRDTGVEPTMQTVMPEMSLVDTWQSVRLVQGKAVADQELQSCAPDPLPVVGYKIGRVHGGEGIVRVPVWMDAAGYLSQGGLLFLEYDEKHMQFVGVEVGEAWVEASFTHTTVNDQIPGHAIFIILGWEIHNGYAQGIDPGHGVWAYVLFETRKPGKSKVTWDTLPDPAPEFFRRGEMLLDVPGLDQWGRPCVWDVIDWFKASPNSTGQMFVEPGYAVVAGGPVVPVGGDVTKPGAEQIRASMRLVEIDALTYEVRVNSNIPLAGGDFRFHSTEPLLEVESLYDEWGVNFFFESMGHIIVDVVMGDDGVYGPARIKNGVWATMRFANPPQLEWVIEQDLPGIETSLGYIGEDGYGVSVPWDQIVIKD